MDEEEMIIEQRPHNPEDECLCQSTACQQQLSHELDSILSPKIILQSPKQLDRLWPIITKNLEILAEYRSEQRCGLAWPPNYVAYRCRTCSKTLTMSLCAECFRTGNHVGHDYNRFLSRSGGACDCGYSIMCEEGFCKRHRTRAKREGEPIPEDLICVPRRMMPRLISRLAIQLRRSQVDLSGETDIYLDWLISLANSSAVLRALMIDALISEKTYSSQNKILGSHPDKDAVRIVKEGLKKLKREHKGLPPLKIPERCDYSQWDVIDRELSAFRDNIESRSFIEEFLLWVIVFEFPQKFVCFLLGFLVDPRFKEIFSRTFVNYYPRIAHALASSYKSEPRRNYRDSFEQLTRRILQVTVQVHNDTALSKLLCDEEHTLHVIIYCLKIAIEGNQSISESHHGIQEGGEILRGVLEPNPLAFGPNPPKIVICDHPIIRGRYLSSFTEDLYTILEYEHEAKRLVSDNDLLNLWLEMVSYFQTMCPHKRELNEHTPYDTSPHVSVISTETEFCLTPLWSLLNRFRDKAGIPFTRTLLKFIHRSICIWFHRMGIEPTDLLNRYHMSFNIPLHRMLAASLRHLIYTHGRPDIGDVYEFLSENQAEFCVTYGRKSTLGLPIRTNINDFLKTLLLHPLQALTLYHETRSSMWTRNGLMTINQANTYVHPACCQSTIDLDMFLIRYCATKLNPNYLLKTLLSRFHTWLWLSFKSNLLSPSAPASEIHRFYNFNILPEQVLQMAESALLTIIQLLTLSIHCNISEREQIRQELVTLISEAERTHSYLVEMLPFRCGAALSDSDEAFASLLDELTIYRPAQHGASGNLQQGCYALKPCAWDRDYNPIHVQYRFYQKREYQLSLERFYQHARVTGKLDKRSHSSALWPPLAVPRTSLANFGQLDLSELLECQSLLGLVYSILFKSVYVSEVPDTIMAYAIHLLELSLRKAIEKSDGGRKTDKDQMSDSFKGKFHFGSLLATASGQAAKPTGASSEQSSQANQQPLSGFADASLIGGPIFSDNTQSIGEQFPIVDRALDLAFDTTWFPFRSVLDNCLVHIGDVHSLPEKEFQSLISADELPPSRDSPMCCQDGSDADFDELDAGDDVESGNGEDEDENDDDDDDVDEDDDDNDSLTVEVGGRQPRSSRFVVVGDEANFDIESRVTSLLHHQHRQLQMLQRAVAARQSGSSVSNAPDTSTAATGAHSRGPHRLPDAADHTYSAPESPSLMDVESLPETQSAALSLVPVPTVATSPQPPTPPMREPTNEQLFPENLVTQRRAILASEPRPMLEAAAQPLALEASRGAQHQRRASASGTDPLASSSEMPGAGGSGTQRATQRQSEQSLSEVDIQTRFMGFFSSRLDPVRPAPLRLRTRQTARRGHGVFHPAHRNAGGTYAVHNPVPALPRPAQIAASNRRAFRRLPELLAARETLLNAANSLADEGDGPRSVAQVGPRMARHTSQLNPALFGRPSQRQERTRLRARKQKLRHGESILSLLLRLHAKYSRRPGSYVFEASRAAASANLETRSRIGDGVHFVTIALDLICASDEQRMCAKLARLRSLAWPELEEAERGIRPKLEPSTGLDTGSGHETLERGANSSGDWSAGDLKAPDAAERRRRAKQFQSKLMAEFASKQRAFIENYEPAARAHEKLNPTAGASSSCAAGVTSPAGSAERPINLSSRLDPADDNAPMGPADKRVEPGQQYLTPRQGQAGEISARRQSTSTPSGADSAAGAPAPDECCICGLDSATDGANPLGQVVLLQSSSVWGHAHLRPVHTRRLPAEGAELGALKEETYAKFLERRIDLLAESFPESGWLDAISIGAEGGVHVQSCGHQLHVECHQTYLKSLDQEDRLRTRSDGDEFHCPVCRQLANSVLPILEVGAASQTASSAAALEHSPGGRSVDEPDARFAAVGLMLAQRPAPDQSHLQSSAAFCAHLTKATEAQYRLVRSKPSMHSLFLFLSSIARTNLEIEVLVRSTPRGATGGVAGKRSCLKLLLHVLALNAQTLISDDWFACPQIWSHLTHCVGERDRLGLKLANGELPLLLRDPTAMLLQFLFAINISALSTRPQYLALVCALFNLTAVQSIALVLSYLPPPPPLPPSTDQATAATISRAPPRTQTQAGGAGPEAQIPSTSATLPRAPVTNNLATLDELTALVSHSLSPLLRHQTEEPLRNPETRGCWLHLEQLRASAVDDETRIEALVQLACLPFLRAAALIQHHLFGSAYPQQSLPLDEDPASASLVAADFRALASCLDLCAESASSSALMGALSWPAAGGCALVTSWADELLRFGAEFSIAARSLLVCRALNWHRPALMRLPYAFDDIFMFYYGRKCTVCGQVPKDVAVCLVCGAPICFRVSCCKDRSRSRQVHSQHCGANTAVFLAVHTSSVVVIRGPRACVWGSVYLDAHDEEDNGLQRGRPLYLVEERYKLLEHQWLTHSFDHTFGKRWIYLQDNQ